VKATVHVNESGDLREAHRLHRGDRIMTEARLQQSSEPGDLPVLPEPGDLVQERYRITGELGRGGMGAVLAAHDEILDRDVALKVVLPRMMRSAEVVERFSNEARSLARLESRHVVKVLDFGALSSPLSCAGLPFMVLERLRGEDLFNFATREGALSPNRVVRFALEACDGLAAAHAQGITHRDLKPENLFVAIEPDGSECLKVLDFGIARSHTRRAALTQGQGGVGSPGYMAPEQVEASGVDGRSDIWALGVVMYELLAHRPAFVGDNPQALCLQILNAPVVPLAELRADLPPALVYVIERCMERDPERRFQNVAELAEALAPLDDWSPASEAERIRRRLDAAEQLVNLTPVRVPSTDEPAPRSTPRRRPRARRVISVVAVGAAMGPLVALLPRVARAPELEPARVWTAQAVASTQAALYRAQDRARDWLAQHRQEPAPPPAQQ
jgi:serine/threonine-protein kinase